MHDLPGSLRLDLDVPVRRALGRAGDAARADAAGRGRGPPGRAARRRARLGQEPPRARVRRARRPRDGALVLYGACDAVVRTPYGPFVEALDHLARVTDPAELRAALGTGGRRAHAPAARPAAPGSASCRRRSRPIRTPSATGCTPRSPTCSPASAAAGRCCSCSRTGTGPTRRRCCCCATWRARPATRACCCSPPSATPRPTCRETLSETLADLRRSDDVVRLRLARPLRRRGRRVRPPRRRRRRRRRRCPSSRRRSATSPTATRSSSASSGARCVETGAVEVVGRRDPAHRARSPSSAARERARGRQPAALAPGARDDRPARARRRRRRRVRARRRPPRRRPRPSPSCSPRSTRRSAAG